MTKQTKVTEALKPGALLKIDEAGNLVPDVDREHERELALAEAVGRSFGMTPEAAKAFEEGRPSRY